VVWWWLGNLALLLLVPVILLLANRVIRPAIEVQRYAGDILDNGVVLAGNLDPVPALADTRDLVATAKSQAVRYVDAATKLA
jgi:hypothetical protein